jgi:hypothetical protein
MGCIFNYKNKLNCRVLSSFFLIFISPEVGPNSPIFFLRYFCLKKVNCAHDYVGFKKSWPPRKTLEIAA